MVRQFLKERDKWVVVIKNRELLAAKAEDLNRISETNAPYQSGFADEMDNEDAFASLVRLNENRRDSLNLGLSSRLGSAVSSRRQSANIGSALDTNWTIIEEADDVTRNRVGKGSVQKGHSPKESPIDDGDIQECKTAVKSTTDVLQKKSTPDLSRSSTCLDRSGFLGSSFLFTSYSSSVVKGQKTPTIAKLRRIFRLVALASHFTKYLSKILNNPIQWGWEHDPDANLVEQRETQGSDGTTTYKRVSAIDFGVSHLFHKNQFQGWLTDRMRSLFRKSPQSRTERELNEMQVWCSTMKAFSKYSPSIQKELLRVGVYERWHGGRIIVGESQRGMYWYVILEGDLEMFKTHHDKLEQDRILISSVDNLNGSQTHIDQYSRQYRINVGNQSSGESFGELGFVNEGLRLASAATRRTTEFLIITKEDYLRIVLEKNDAVTKSKIAFLRKLPLLKTLSASLETVALYSEVRAFAPDSIVVAEGDICDNLLFLRSGTCRLVKSVPYLKVPARNGTYRLEVLGLGVGETGGGGARATDKSRSWLRESQVTAKFLAVRQLVPCDYFFDGSHAIDVQDLGFRAGTIIVTSKMTVIANTRCEFLVITKVDFNKFASKDTWKTLTTMSEIQHTQMALPPIDVLSQKYKESRRWSLHKKRVIEDYVNGQKHK
ncbi:hypothetical protein BC830DRAFT_1166189 [Chytriomyces sp. MP71]|nr:hypothetical protein BC830DRAFT_1166189 [Chytriomyces sp. MP71]